MGTSDETHLLLRSAPDARQALLAEIFTRHRERLRWMLELRLDRRLQARVDPSDVLQETFLEASRRLDEYCRDAPVPVFIWIRRLAVQKLIDLHRLHVESRKRSPAREVSMDQAWGPPSHSGSIAEKLLGHELSPSQAAIQAEAKALLEEALDRMEEVDREIVALRHFELLTSGETGEILGMRPDAVRQRYLRAIGKLRRIILEMPGAREELKP